MNHQGSYSRLKNDIVYRMKKRNLIVTVCALALFFTWVVSPALAQDVYVPFAIKEYPVQFKHTNDFEVKRVGNFTYVVENPATFSQFYIKGMKVSQNYTADSLQSFFINKIYKDEDILNLQLREKGRGTMGNYEADKVVLSFAADDKLYLSTIYLVYFYVNQEYNAILFYFEMGERAASSYTGLQENMIQTLEWLPLSYVPYRDEKSSTSIDYPDFWRIDPLEENDTLLSYTAGDGRGSISIRAFTVKDSLEAKDIALNEFKTLKTSPGIYTSHKLKASGDKWYSGEACGRWTGTYTETAGNFKRSLTLNRYYIKHIVNDKLVLYRIDLLCPEYNVSYYSPIFNTMAQSIKLPGNAYIAPKKK